LSKRKNPDDYLWLTYQGKRMSRITAFKITQKYELHLIEDATESLGAKYNDKYTGTFGEFGCFSFNGNKTITTGGGGMITGKNTKRLEHIKFLINQVKRYSKRQKINILMKILNIKMILKINI
jgi:dTDP-4-amino-4,6-dideoxygalactose transaminase